MTSTTEDKLAPSPGCSQGSRSAFPLGNLLSRLQNCTLSPARGEHPNQRPTQHPQGSSPSTLPQPPWGAAPR